MPTEPQTTTASFIDRWTKVIKETPFRKEQRPVECDLCGWKGRRLKPRSAPCPSCGNGKVQFR